MPIGFLFIFMVCFNSIQATAAESLEVIDVKADKQIQDYNFSKIKKISKESEINQQELLIDSLSAHSSVILNQNGGIGGRTSLFIRGTEGRHVGYFIDGMRINDSSNTDRQFDAAFLNSSPFQSIEVALGPQSVLYGPDSLGGAVLLQTHKGEKAPEGRLSLFAGSFETMGANYIQDWRKLGHQGSVNFYQFYTGGISRLNEKRFNATERDSTEAKSLSSSSRHSWSPVLSTDFLVWYTNGKNEIDGTEEDEPLDKSFNDHYLVQQKSSLGINDRQILSLRNGFSRHDRRVESADAETQSYGGNYLQNELVHQFEKKDFKLLTGLGSEREDFSQARKEFDVHSLFVQVASPLKKVQVQSGIRLEQHSRYGEFHTGTAGIRYPFQENELSLQYSQGYKTPSLYQLFGPEIYGFPVGNPDLEPELSRSWEISWNRKLGNANVGATLFRNELSKLITYTNSGYLNQESFDVEGVELEGTIKFRRIHFTGSATHQKFKDNSYSILRRPENSYKLRSSFLASENNEFQLDWSGYSPSFDLGPDGNRVKLNGFEVFDFGYKKSFDEYQLNLKVQNLLNREYEVVYGASTMPRSFLANLAMRFN